ncbi:MAG: potassium-transporting ATPase subunit KdpA [Deltaproteobacteria bacterium]|nr:potassium-transporting ATPase subunit KdpA [Deltaproteobacteria bacterium]
MTVHSVFEILIYFCSILLLTSPMGFYLAKVFGSDDGKIIALARRFERFLYRLVHIDAQRPMCWREYTIAMLLFSFCGLLLSYTLLRLQGFLPLNPLGLGANEMTPDLAFNTAASFASNTNWQSYAPESTVSSLSNMVALSIHNWMSAATGIAVAVAIIRGFTTSSTQNLGNFWADITRATLYVFVPLCFIGALVFVWTGSPQTFEAPRTITTLEGAAQTIPLGPVASQEVIKHLGTNGGGFYNANSAHPFENPNPASDQFTKLLIFLIPAGLTSLFGRMSGNRRQGWALFAAMSVLFLTGAFVCNVAEQSGNPNYARIGVDQTASDLQAGGNMEGKEVRFGISSSTLFATVTTAASCGAVNSMHDSFTPLGGLVPLFNILSGEVIFGGVGAGLYGMLMFAVLAVFIAGLMVGRTPEYLGKKIGRFQVQMAMLSVLVLAGTILGATALSANLPFSMESAWNRVGSSGPFLGATTNNLNNAGSHGFSEILYAFASATGNNGSAFAGLTANTPYYNLILGLAMLAGRFLSLIPLLAMAGSLAAAKKVPESSGTLPTDTATFVFLLIGTVLIVGALTFFPALALGPIVEHFQMNSFLLQ